MSFQAYLDTIQRSTGKTPADLRRLAEEKGFTSGGPLAPGVKATAVTDWLKAEFEREVLRGPGAFWMLADDYDGYKRAMRAKLLRELDTPAVSGWPLVDDGA